MSRAKVEVSLPQKFVSDLKILIEDEKKISIKKIYQKALSELEEKISQKPPVFTTNQSVTLS